MAKKKQEIQLQREIETQEEWEEVMAMEGLWVVDVYQEWCGPCLALTGNFRRLKNELGDSLLNFAIAKADTIDALDKYRGRCEPSFLFFAGGILVSFIHGANSPKVQRVITEQLAQEHKVMEGTGERKEVKDPVITRIQEREKEKGEDEEAARAAEEQRGVTIAIIKPDIVAMGKIPEIITELQEKGIEILAREDRELTDDEARELYSDLEDEDYFLDLIRFVTSGPSHLLVLTNGETGDNIVKDWRDIIGPNNVEEAKEEAPDSLRAKYGDKGYMNGLHGSSSEDTAAKELAFFFPNLAVPTYLKKKENIQRTLALIRPEAFSAHKDAIIGKIQQAGFSIALYKEVQLSKEQAEEFYKEHEGSAYFEQLVNAMSSGPLLALGLARDDAISAWRDMLGPKNIDEALEQAPNSLRAAFIAESGINQFHGSDSEQLANKELNFFFPMEETIAVIKPKSMGTKDAIIERIHEAGFRIAAHKETNITRQVADILYANQQDKSYYKDLVTSITSGPTYFMVLSKEGAVDGWRREIGDTDPETAKTNNPDSIRAKFGQSIMDNAVHGSSTYERAREEMQAVFGDLEFNEDGTVKGEQPELDKASVEKTNDETADNEAAMDQRTVDQDTTQVQSADVTADPTQKNETQAETEGKDITETDTNAAETTQAEVVSDATVADQESSEPTMDQMMEEPNAGDQITTDQSTVDHTTADQTKTDQSTVDQTTADQTTTDQTTAEQTTTDQSTADQSTVDQTTADQSKTDQTTTDQSTVNQLTVDQTTADQTTADQSTVDQSTVDQSTVDQTTADKTTTDQSTADQLTANQTTTDQSTADQSTADHSTADQSTVYQTTADQSTVDQTTADQSTVDQSTAEQTTADQSTADQLKDDQTIVDQTTDQPTSGEKTSGETQATEGQKQEEKQQVEAAEQSTTEHVGQSKGQESGDVKLDETKVDAKLHEASDSSQPVDIKKDADEVAPEDEKPESVKNSAASDEAQE